MGYDAMSTDVTIGSEENNGKKPKHKSKKKPGNFSEETKMQAPTVLQKIFRNRNQKNSQYYFTQSSLAEQTGIRNVLNENSPFVYPKELEEFSYKVMARTWHHKQRLEDTKEHFSTRPTYRSRNNRDILNRLFVHEPENNVKALTDIDPEYFSIVEGRPIRDTTSVQQYIEDARNCLKTKLMIGFKEDEILLADKIYTEEKDLIAKIKNEYKTYMNSYEEFLAKDHSESMRLLKEADDLYVLSSQKAAEYLELSKQLGIVKIDLYRLEEQWRNCKMYQAFLYQISPITWRKENDFIHRGRGKRSSFGADAINVLGKYRLASTGDIASLETLIDMFFNEVEVEEEPKLYFTTPSELFKVFHMIQMQNLNSLLHSESLSAPLESMSDCVENVQSKFEQEVSDISETIRNLEIRIVWNEDRAKDLERKSMEQINTIIKHIVSNDDAINMHVYVEDLYESVIAPNDSNLNMYEMMKAVEQFHESYLLQLDDIPYEIVQAAELEQRTESRRSIKMAKDATRKMDLINILTKKLRVALEPPPKKTTKPLFWRSPPPKRKVKPPAPPPVLTVEEKMNKEFFSE